MRISYSRQDVLQEDIDAVTQVLRADFLTQGPVVPEFEAAVASHSGARHAVASNSGTSALHIACLALDVGPGDEVWTTPITFVASANCALYCGASVDFVDIDPKTYNMSADLLEQKLARAERLGRLPKVVIPVAMSGQPCEMERISSLAKKYGFSIIEDASHAVGARYLGEPVGSCRFSDITIFSFHPVKIITSGEGGMALTNDPELAERMRLLRSHGITSSPSEMVPRPPEEIWNYQQIGLGFNYRMTDIHGALGLSQMRRVDAYVEARRRLAARYDRLLVELPLTIPWQHPDTYSSYHLYVVRLRLEEIVTTHRQAFQDLQALGILVNLHYIPVYRQEFYKNMGFERGYCPEAEAYFHEALSIPLYPGLTDEQQDLVIDALRQVLTCKR